MSPAELRDNLHSDYRPSSLPDTDTMRLRVRRRNTQGFGFATLLWATALTAMLATVATFVMRTLSPSLGGFNILLFVIFGSVVLAVPVTIYALAIATEEVVLSWSLPRFYLWTFSLALAWTTTRVLYTATNSTLHQFLFFLCCIAAFLFLLDAVLATFLRWCLATPLIPSEKLEYWEHRWQHRFHDNFYRLPFLAIGGAVVIGGLVAAISGGRFVGLVAFIITFILTALLAIVVARAAPRAFKNTYTAVFTWLNYCPSDMPCIGVYTPRFRAPVRRIACFVVVALLASSTAVLTSYYAFVPLFGPSESWVQAYRTLRSGDIPEVEVAPLTAEEKAILNAVSIQDRQELAQRITERNTRQAEAEQDQDIRNATFDKPETWLLLAADFSNTLVNAAGVVPFIASTLLLPLFLGFSSVVVCGRFLHAVKSDLREYTNDDTPEEWDAIVGQIQHSNHFDERNEFRESDHLFLGFHQDDYPALLHRHILNEHAFLSGDSGSGKTSIGMSPMLAQLIRLSGIRRWQLDEQRRQQGDKPGQWSHKDQISVVVFDMKGDPALFNNARLEAERAGLPFKWFTNLPDRSTHTFNVFQQGHIKNSLSVPEKTELLLQSLGLNYGEGYGKGYYGGVNEKVLRHLLEEFDDQIECFADLARLTHSLTSYRATDHGKGTRSQERANRDKEWQDATHLFSKIEAQAAIPAMNVTAKNAPHRAVLDQHIDMADLLETPQVVYFYLTSMTQPIAIASIAKLALFTMISATERRSTNERLQVYAFMDEFQQIASHNLGIILRQARSKGIAAILAAQSLEDLYDADNNLLNTVETNTVVKRIFRVSSSKDAERLIKFSGESIIALADPVYRSQIKERLSTGGGFSLRRYLHNEPEADDPSLKLSNRYRINDVLLAGYNNRESLTTVVRPSGFTDFGPFMFTLDASYHISKEEHERRNSEEMWPEASHEDGTFLAEDIDLRASEERQSPPSTPPPPKRPKAAAKPPKPAVGNDAKPARGHVAPSELQQQIQQFKKAKKDLLKGKGST